MQKTALVVDDSKSARFALRRHLEGHAFKVDTADSAADAYRFVRQQRPDLIFLDHIMPDVDGFEALRQLKQDPATASIPVVICSSNEGEAFVAEARDQGAADVLPKPPTPAHLQRLLDSLEQQTRQQEIDASLEAAEDGADDDALLLAEAEAAPAAAPATSDASAELQQLRARIEALERHVDAELAALRTQLAQEIEQARRTLVERFAQGLMQALRDAGEPR